MSSARHLDAARLRCLLHYDPETGVFRWLVNRGPARPGAVAGCITKAGYRYIGIDGRYYMGQRLAWLYMTGKWPEGEVDHRNVTPGDDRWENLREATRVGNCRNTRKRRNNTSGAKGVSWNADRGKWMAQIMVNGRNIYLGLFTDLGAASAAYAIASEQLHGEYGRTK